MLAKCLCALSFTLMGTAAMHQGAEVKTNMQVEGKSMVQLLQDSSLDLSQFSILDEKTKSKSRNKHRHQKNAVTLAAQTKSANATTNSTTSVAVADVQRDKFGRDKDGKFKDHDKFLDIQKKVNEQESKHLEMFKKINEKLMN